MPDYVSGWVEPLLAPIKANQSTVVFPNIERISPQLFNVGCNPKVSWNGIFRVSDLTFQWGRISKEERDERRRDGNNWAKPVRCAVGCIIVMVVLLHLF